MLSIIRARRTRGHVAQARTDQSPLSVMKISCPLKLHSLVMAPTDNTGSMADPVVYVVHHPFGELLPFSIFMFYMPYGIYSSFTHKYSLISPEVIP